MKHEFAAGEVFAAAGTEDRRVTARLNVAMALRRRLQGSPCRTFMSGMTLHVDAAGSVFYPDVMVPCHSDDRGDKFAA